MINTHTDHKIIELPPKDPITSAAVGFFPEVLSHSHSVLLTLGKPSDDTEAALQELTQPRRSINKKNTRWSKVS